MTSVADNYMRWNGKPGHYEVWFLAASHRARQAGLWIRHTLTAPTPERGLPAYSQLWFAWFDGRDRERSFAVNRKLPIESLRASADPFSVEVGEALLGHGLLRGSLIGDGHHAEWDLAFAPEEHGVRTLPDWAYASARVGTKFLAPHFAVPLRGRVVVDGDEVSFDGEQATQCHLWGHKHAHTWGWGHASAFLEDEETAIDVLSVRLRKGPVVLPRLTLVTLRRGGDVTSFHGPLDLLTGRSECGPGYLRFAATAPTLRVRGDFSAPPADMVLAEYTDPDGEAAFCHNSEIATLTLTIETRGWLSGWREAARLTAPRTAHFELAARSPDSAVARRHRTIGG
jgi:hypothetical protein